MKCEEKRKTKVSVVIPVYNCEKYLEKCLHSVLNQTLQEIEIICVDDGSTDDSAKILKNFAQTEERIVLQKQKNQGAGKARNTGIEIAKGKYIAFLDADDYYVDCDALEKMYYACEKEKVSVCGSLRMVLEEDGEKKGSLFSELFFNNQDEVICDYRDYQLDYDYQSFLFERELLQIKRIEFPLYRRFQDPPFLVKALFAAQKFAVANTYLYCYRVPNIAFRFNERKTADLLRGLNDNLEFAREHQLDLLFEKTLERLEYEYADLICHNLSEENLEILELLWKANQIVCEKYQKKDSVIRPLKMILCGAKQNIAYYEENLTAMIKEQETIAIYGAGKLARRFLRFLKDKQLLNRVSCMIVSDLNGNDDRIEEIPVVPISQYQEKKDEVILVTLGVINHKNVVAQLEMKQIENYILIDNVFLESL